MISDLKERHGKVVSDRFVLAARYKHKAGKVAGLLRKKGVKITAKQLVEMWIRVHGHLEWHHSGCFGTGKNIQMGKTYFFSSEQVDYLLNNYESFVDEFNKCEKAYQEEIIAAKAKIVKGYYWLWEKDGRSWAKKLEIYEGPLADVPYRYDRFCECNDAVFEEAKKHIGELYHGWDVPEF